MKRDVKMLRLEVRRSEAAAEPCLLLWGLDVLGQSSDFTLIAAFRGSLV